MNRVGNYDVETAQGDEDWKRGDSYLYKNTEKQDNQHNDGWGTPTPENHNNNKHDTRKSPVSGYISPERFQRRQSLKIPQQNVSSRRGLLVKTAPLSQRLREISDYEKEEFQNRKNTSWLRCKLACTSLGQQIELWGGALRSIEGHQGTGVVSFFVLLRWLLGLNIALFVISFIFLSLPVLTLTQNPYSLNSTIMCSDAYSATASTDSLQLFLDFFMGSGWMEKTQMFYGFYAGSSLYSGSSDNPSLFYDFPLAYLLVIIICLLICVFMMARHSVSAFRKNALSGEIATTAYITMIYSNWDYSMSNERLSQIKERKLRYVLTSDMQEQRFRRERQSSLEKGSYKCMLYSIRMLVNLFVLGCLCGAGYAIFKASEFSSSWTTTNTVENGTSRFLIFLVEFVPSITITVLNAILPLVFEVVIMAEKYTQDFVIKLTLVRTVFLKLSSVAILISSLYTGVIGCSIKDSCGTTTSPCPTVTCWETYVGQELYKLAIIDFFVIILIVFLVEFPRRLIANKCSWSIVKMIGPAAFDIPKNVLDLVYSQSICWLGFFFVPLFPALYMVRLIIIFYVKMLSALFACEPPNRPYRAARTNSFFMVVLIVTFFLSCFPVIYSIANVNPSKGCGPFRVYDFPYQVIPGGIQNLQLSELTTTYNVLTSPAVTASFIIILLVLLYYCSKLRVAHKDRIKLLRAKLVVENQDRQYLLEQLKKEH